MILFLGPGVRLLRGRGQWLPAVPRVLPRGLPRRSGGNDQVELHLPQRDDIRPGNPVNIKVALHMKISQSARLFICNFKSESSPVIVQLIHQADGRTIKWAPWKNVLFLVCNWIWPQCNELTLQYFSRIMMIYVCRHWIGWISLVLKTLHTMFFVFSGSSRLLIPPGRDSLWGGSQLLWRPRLSKRQIRGEGLLRLRFRILGEWWMVGHLN